MDRCIVAGCTTTVSRDGFKLCLPHWRTQREGGLRDCERCGAAFEARAGSCLACASKSSRGGGRPQGEGWFSSTKIGERFGLSSRKVNLLFSELGWIERFVKGWVPTEQGTACGAVRREIRETGVPYVVWPASIVENRVLLASVRELSGESEPGTQTGATAPPAAPSQSSDPGADFRSRFPATIRTQDGHLVRSRAEAMIDDWLYMQGIVHAYERRLPLDDDETVYCDFYLREKRVYIEYWGLENDAKYAERKARKLAVYARHGFQLVELTDDDIANLDEALPRKLMKLGIECD